MSGQLLHYLIAEATILFQGNAATYLRCGGKTSMSFVGNLLLFAAAKEFCTRFNIQHCVVFLNNSQVSCNFVLTFVVLCTWNLIFQNGFYSALPFLGLWATTIICPIIADKLRSAGVLSTLTVRRVFNSIGKMHLFYCY